MSQYLAAMFRRRPNDGWFRFGRYDVTTVDIVSALAVFSMFIYAADRATFARLAFNAPAVRNDFEIWRIFTWPIATQPDLFALIGVIFFWVFGQQLEGLFGRNKFLIWVIAVTITPSISLTILGSLSPSLDLTSFNFGLSTLFLTGIWVYAATYPNVRWFEIMPIWGIAAIFTGLNLLSFTGDRAGGAILFMLIAIAAGLSVARSLGLATAWPIPHIPISDSGGRPKRSKPPKPKRRSKRDEGGQRVVEGPWRGTSGSTLPKPPPVNQASPADQAELDGLLDKIASNGMDSLSTAEKQRLNELSKRLRNR